MAGNDAKNRASLQRSDPEAAMDDFHENLIDGGEGIREAVRGAKRVAVLGIKTEEQSGQPAFYVPAYLAEAGVEVVPVPVYYPEVTTILGKKVYRKLAD